MARVLVTGCCGFIGSNLVESLIGKGFEVSGIDDMSTGRPHNTDGMDYDFHRGSVNDRKLLMKALEGADFVLHHAAIPSVPQSISDPLLTNSANVDGTLSVLVCARDAGVKRLVFASSSSVYGNNPELPKKETMRPDPASPYALMKLTGETYCRLFTEIYGFETVSLRYFNIFGPRQNPDSQYSAVIPKFIKLMLRGEMPTIFGDGSQSRDFSFVDNVVEANMLSMKAPKAAAGKAYNIACGERTTLTGLVKMINGMIGKDIKPLHAAEREGDIMHSLADISLAGRMLGYQPKVLFREGLERTVAWYKGGGGHA